MKESVQIYQEHVETKLIIRQRIFMVVITILIIIGIINTVQGKMSPVLALSGFLIATTIGLLLSRMFKIFWHEEKQKVVSKLDATGGILLFLYIIIEIGRTQLFSHWLSGAALTAFSLVILTGLLLGRFLGTLFKIKQVLAEDVIE